MKKMKKIRFLSLVLCLLMSLTLVTACASDKTDNSDSVKDSSAPDSLQTEPETKSPYDDKGYLLDSLPDDLKFDGKTFNLFTWSNQTMWEWDADTYSGELLKDAIYERKQFVESRMGIKLVITSQAGEWDNRASFIQTVAANVNAGAHSYDLIGQYTPAAAIGAMQSLYVDLRDVEYLDLSKPWWPGDITESSSINGRLYFTTGDITPTLIRNMGTVMANLDMINDYNLGDVYALVDNGEWTLDKLSEIALGVVGDQSNADQKYAVTIANNVTFDNLFYAGGFKYVESNSDGTLKLSESIQGEKMVNWYKKCQSFLNDNSDVALLAINNAFTSGSSIFHMGQISDVQNYLKDVSMNFAILPYPKYSVEQENYYTIVGYWVSMYSIPTDAPDFAMSGAVLEALGSAAYRSMTPAFYKEAFQYRFLDTEVNARMFDLLHDTLVYDTGRTFCDQIDIFAVFRKAATAGTDWSSTLASSKTLWSKKITAIYDKLG